MTPVLLFFVFLFGMVFGSFLNVCIYRIPRDLSVVAPRSFCPECGSQLSWRENVPILSYLLLRGRCRRCLKPIGLRYLVVELTTGLICILIASTYGFTVAAVKWAIFEMLLTVLFWTDLEERILPNELTVGGALAGLIFAAVVKVPGGVAELLLPASGWRSQSLLNAALGSVILSVPVWVFGSVYGRIRKREALGFGDVKLLMALGAFLGLERGVGALMTGAVAGAVVGVGLLIWKRREALSYELPFGSFLCLAAALLPLFSQ
jgi:leader peptidase (prepilin peptidase) / N-methyltransferase